MAQTPGTKLTATELAALEHAFAADPSSGAYRPLAEAYLAMGRFMEAMVVCKKGVKAHPSSAEARLLLARVYGDQGKDRKAIDEVKGALEVAPEDADVLRYAAELHFKVGEDATGAEQLKKAAGKRPDDAAILSLARKHNVVVELPKPPPPPPPPEPPVVVRAPEAAVAQGPEAFPAPAAHGNGVHAAAPASYPAAPPPVLAHPGQPAAALRLSPAPAPAPRPAAPRRAAVAQPAHDPQFDYSRLEDEEAQHRSRRSKKGFLTLIITGVAGLALLGGWYGFTKWKAAKDRQISKLLEDTNNYIQKDTYASYKKATETADQILELDSGNFVAHAYLAYINGLRWGEQGEGDDYKRRAQEHLAKAKAPGEPHGRIISAEAYIQFFNGDGKAAEATVQAILDKGQKSGLLYTTLGIIQMYGGNLDQAAQTLKQAQSLESNSVRLLSALGQLNRRRGMDAEAYTFYDSALRIDREHADSLLGKALLVLDANEGSRPKEEQEALLKEAEAQIGKVMNLPDGAISARQLALGKFADAQLLYARSKEKEAEKLEQEAFTLDPNNPDIRLMRGRRLLRQGNADAAVKEIREAITIDDRRASFYVDLSRALMAKPGGAKEAVGALQKAQKTFPDSGKIWVLVGDAQRAVPDAEAARLAYERAIEVEKGRMPEARAKLGRSLREKKDYARARTELEKSITEFGLGASGPAIAVALGELGRINEEAPAGDKAEGEKLAYDLYQKALSSSDRYAPAYFLIARIAASRARDPEFAKLAKEYAKQYLELEPKGEFAGEAARISAGGR